MMRPNQGKGNSRDRSPLTGECGDHPHAEDGMAELFVLGFPSKEKAEAVLEVGCDLQRQVLLDLEDAALVWRTADGTIKVQQSFSPAMVGSASVGSVSEL